MSALVGRIGRHPLVYVVALLVAVLLGAAVAYAQRFGGADGFYILFGILLVASVVVTILVQWRLGALLLVAALPYETLLTSGTLASRVRDTVVSLLPYEDLISVETLASGVKGLALLTFLSLTLALLRDQRLFERFLRLWQEPLTLAVLAFLLWVLASTLWATEQGAALGTATTLTGLFGLMVVIGMLEVRYLVAVWAVTAFSTVLSVPAGYILPDGSETVDIGRLSPGGADPNTYAGLLAIVLFVAYFGLLRRYRIYAYILAPVLLYGVIATQSRTGLIALVATPLLAVFVPRMAARMGGWRILLMYVLGAAALVGLFFALPAVGDSLWDRYTAISQVQSEDTWTGRWSIWQAAFQIIGANPVLGVGAGNFAYFALGQSAEVAENAAARGEITGVAHNMFLGITSELGFVGLILFLGILFFVFRAALQVSRKWALGTGVFLGLIAFTIAGLTLTWEYREIGYILFGSVLALHLQLGQDAILPGKREDDF